MNPIYLDTARILTQVAPLVFVDDTFALKGGTAINLFIRDMPRLSVDLDLVFADHVLPRDQALAWRRTVAEGRPEEVRGAINRPCKTAEHLTGCAESRCAGRRCRPPR